jgi:hypothetical protein
MSSLFSNSRVKLTILLSSKSTFPMAIASRIVVSFNSCCKRLVVACSRDSLFHSTDVRQWHTECGSERSHVVRSWSRISSPRVTLICNALISWSRLITASWTADSLTSYLDDRSLLARSKNPDWEIWPTGLEPPSLRPKTSLGNSQNRIPP